jgi:isocitrate lyase
MKDRFANIKRNYTDADVSRLKGKTKIEHTLAKIGAERFWKLINERPYVHALGASTGAMAVQQVKAGLEAIYLSGWQVAADANLSGNTYPDQSLYPANSVPAIVRRINNALLRSEQIDHAENPDNDKHWMAPIVADAEAGFGGPLNAYELMKAMIEAGFIDQIMLGTDGARRSLWSSLVRSFTALIATGVGYSTWTKRPYIVCTRARRLMQSMG